MDKLFDTEHGLPSLLAGITVILALHLVLKIGEVLWEVYRKKDELSAKNVESLKTTMLSVESRMIAIERDLNEVLKLRKDLKVYFEAVKLTAGARWPKISKTARHDGLD